MTNTAQAERSRRAPSRHAHQSKHRVPLRGKQGLLVRYRGRSPNFRQSPPGNRHPKAGKPGKAAAKAVRMLTAAAEAGVVELSRLAVRLTCSSHISSEQLGGRFSRRGVRAAEKISEVGFLYGNPGRHAQPHTTHKPPFHSENYLPLGSTVSVGGFCKLWRSRVVGARPPPPA